MEPTPILNKSVPIMNKQYVLALHYKKNTELDNFIFDIIIKFSI